jgi:hypothetical protein
MAVTPLIADGDTGYGGLLNIRSTVRGYEAAGAVIHKSISPGAVRITGIAFWPVAPMACEEARDVGVRDFRVAAGGPRPFLPCCLATCCLCWSYGHRGAWLWASGNKLKYSNFGPASNCAMLFSISLSRDGCHRRGEAVRHFRSVDHLTLKPIGQLFRPRLVFITD